MKNLTNNIILHQNIGKTEFIQFKKLLEFPEIKHCYTLRKNNINIQLKDDDKSIITASYQKVGEVLGIAYENIVKPHQTHTDRVEVVNNICEQFEEVDGLITDKKDICLCTTSADCTSLLFYDYKNKVIGDVHSGWRGTLQKIGKKAVERMIKTYECKPENIICSISPCIKKCHFEVEEEVASMFKKEFEYTGRINEIIEIGRIVEGIQKYNIDTTLINQIILAEIGLRKENIIDSNICTVCNSDLFHSYRKDKELSGRNGAFIGMV